MLLIMPCHVLSNSTCHTEGQLEASVQQHEVGRRVAGATDHIFPHQHLRVQGPPLSWTLLVETQQTERQRQNVFSQGPCDQAEVTV